MSGFAIRVKTKLGQQVVKNLNANSTVEDLKKQLSDVSSIPINRMHVLWGFPPKPFDLTVNKKLLSDIGLKSGDTLILEEKLTGIESPKSTRISDYANVKDPRHHTAENRLDCPGILMKQIVPADNSCLFTSIYYVLNGKVDDSGQVAPWMRQIISETISKDQFTYSEAILGKANDEYCKWILKDTSWGGAIELAILSMYYGIEIDVVDTINGIINRFGEDQKYAHRVFLLFDGIHYDPLYLEPLQGGDIQTIFPVEDERILQDAEQLAQEAKSSRQFTDVNKFTLKCLICNVLLTGQIQAQQHAHETGHANFGEV